MNIQKRNYQNFISVLLSQKKMLIKKIPELKYYFIDIYYPKLKQYIPFLPIGCFRDFDLYASPFSEKPSQLFVSSGSTNSVRARHSFSKKRIDDYGHHATEGLKKFLNHHKLVEPIIVSLIPDPDEWPESSLSAMIKMFENKGTQVFWCKPETFLSTLKNIVPGKNVIIFGTTFHHLQLINSFNTTEKKAQKNLLFQNLNLSIIDTGGTKGKTEAFSLRETKKIFTEFYSLNSSRDLDKKLSNQKIKFFSEYGMCELSSQAWSLSADHNNTFIANKTLIPFAIDLKSFKILSHRQTGFLGFIDTLNYESYPAIITEDLGYIISHKDKSFKLLGRSPDATIKGCSLNIKNFQFSDQSTNPILDYKQNKILRLKRSKINEFKNNVENFNNIQNKLNKSYWNIWNIENLKTSLESVFDLFDGQNFNIGKNTDQNLEHKIFKDKNILLISAANTPISFVYPLLIAALNDAGTITLKIPSIRLNDPLSKKIRNQIIDLYKYLAMEFRKTKFYLSTSKSLENNFHNYDCIFAFGTDETLKVINQRASQNTKIFGFGDIKNAFIINSNAHTPKFLAEICSAWYGRGCLTPICLFVESETPQDYCQNFFHLFSEIMAERFASLRKVHLHAHNLLNFQACLKKNGLNTSCVLSSDFVAVIDLSKYSMELIQKLNLDFSIGGCGLVFVLPHAAKAYMPGLSFDSMFPTIFEFSKKLAPETNQDSLSIPSSKRH